MSDAPNPVPPVTDTPTGDDPVPTAPAPLEPQGQRSAEDREKLLDEAETD